MSQHDGEPQVERHFNFFVPGELALMIEHDEPLTSGELLDALRDVPLVRENETLVRAIAQVNPRINITTASRQPPESNPPSPRGCAGIITGLFDQLLGRSRPRQARFVKQAEGQQSAYLTSIFLDVGHVMNEWKNPRTLIEQLVAPSDEALMGGRGKGSRVTVTSISPNWLINSAQPILTVGGPGARPVAPNKSALSNAGTTEPWRFRFLGDNGQEIKTCSSGEGVDIFVLDTAPTEDQFRRAYKQGRPLNPLLGRLIAPDGVFSLNNRRFEVRYSHGTPIQSEIQRLSTHTQGAAESGHADYDMLDHGLFAAGIAASIAPESRIVLMEVLGRWGVGSLRTVVEALNSLLNRPTGRPMVINLSLTFDIPFGKHVSHRAQVPLFAVQHRLFQAEWGWFTQWLDEHEPYVRRSLIAVEDACRALAANHCAVVVAASGNDSFGASTWCDPRFPAAFEEVVGVGALDRAQKPAPYSNRPDTPEEVGIITFGGNVDPNTGSPGTTIDDHVALSADADEGILGLYIGALPGAQAGTHPEDGWARWAGTSFATPIVAGFLATALSECKSPQKARDAVDAVINAATEPGGKAQVLRAVQG